LEPFSYPEYSRPNAPIYTLYYRRLWKALEGSTVDTTASPVDEVTTAADTTTAAGGPTGGLQNAVYYTHVFENVYQRL